ncbi:MAG: FAD-dependent oxidoreductase [Bacilli bacterium]|jgi:thioredoxin reductase (NADPH)|nr:FAD-dependent oxidoreductase [Bacilli bacterium]
MGNEINKVAIIGMGPSGIAAAIYLKRSNISPICFEENEIGGKLNIIHEIENYPGFIGDGKDLAVKFTEQVKHFEIDIRKESVRSISKNDDGNFDLKTDKSAYRFQAVIIAAGIRNKPFKVPGSDAYFENGLSRCAECDAPFHKNKPVAVIGNTSEALKDTEYLSSICNPVYLINPNETFQASEKEMTSLHSLKNVMVFSSSEIVASSGARRLEHLVIKNKVSGEEKTLDVEGLFIFLGSTPMSEFLGYMDVLDEKGQIKVDEHMRTPVEGLFAVGDVRNAVLRQVITAVSDGGVGAVSCRAYLHDKEQK